MENTSFTPCHHLLFQAHQEESFHIQETQCGRCVHEEEMEWSHRQSKNIWAPSQNSPAGGILHGLAEAHPHITSVLNLLSDLPKCLLPTPLHLCGCLKCT